MSWTWSDVALSAAGGTYRLCWCGGLGQGAVAAGLDCKLSEHFRTDAGTLRLIGPSPQEQHKTCVAGLTCRFTHLYGVDLSTLDHYMVLDTCAVEDLEEHFAHTGLSRHSVLPGQPEWGSSPDPNATGLLTSGLVTTFSWASVTTSAGGQYRLCWCAGSLSPRSDGTAEQDDIQHCGWGDSAPWVDIGEFTLVGPSPLPQARTCISGQRCALFGGIDGQDLASENRVLVLDTCGERYGRADLFAEMTPRWPSVEVVGAVTGGISVSWGEEPVSSAGGTYRMCWCVNMARCKDARAFVVDVGPLMLIGPSPLRQDRTCASGQTCFFDGILGQGLTDGDRYLFLDECGGGSGDPWDSTTEPPRFTHAGRSVLSGSSGAAVSWGPTRTTAAGGTYRLCWCREGLAPHGGADESSCLIAEDIYIYIYIYIYNLHLGLINAPPYFVFSSKRPFSLFIYYQTGQKYTNLWPRLC